MAYRRASTRRRTGGVSRRSTASRVRRPARRPVRRAASRRRSGGSTRGQTVRIVIDHANAAGIPTATEALRSMGYASTPTLPRRAKF